MDATRQQQYFPTLESFSGRPDDREQGIQHQPPVPASEGGCNNTSEPLENLQTAPIQVTDDNRNVVQELDRISEVADETSNSEVLHPEDDPQNQGKRSRIVGFGLPKTAIRLDTTTQQKDQGRNHPEIKKRCKLRYVGLIILVMSLGIVSLLGSAALVCRLKMPNNLEYELTSSIVEILQDNTVLAYRGNTSNLVITASFETHNKLSSSQQLSVTLYVVDCDELKEHKKPRILHDKMLTLSENVPSYIPAGYPHYEVGSMFNYSITSNQVPAESSLSVLFFNNTTEAAYYKNNHMDPMARAKAIRVEPVPINTSYTFPFVPKYGAYFIPIFQITGEDFNIDLSYSITQVFYLGSDYVPYTNCSLSLNETCSFDFSTHNETCVLAYNLPQKNAVLLSASIKTETDKVPPFKAHVHIVAYIFLAVFICLLPVAVIFCARILKMKCSTKNNDYAYGQLPKQRSTIA